MLIGQSIYSPWGDDVLLVCVSGGFVAGILALVFELSKRPRADIYAMWFFGWGFTLFLLIDTWIECKDAAPGLLSIPFLYPFACFFLLIWIIRLCRKVRSNWAGPHAHSERGHKEQ
jgi:hypothetical protein